MYFYYSLFFIVSINLGIVSLLSSLRKPHKWIHISCIKLHVDVQQMHVLNRYIALDTIWIFRDAHSLLISFQNNPCPLIPHLAKPQQFPIISNPFDSHVIKQHMFFLFNDFHVICNPKKLVG